MWPVRSYRFIATVASTCGDRCTSSLTSSPTTTTKVHINDILKEIKTFPFNFCLFFLFGWLVGGETSSVNAGQERTPAYFLRDPQKNRLFCLHVGERDSTLCANELSGLPSIIPSIQLPTPQPPHACLAIHSPWEN